MNNKRKIIITISSLLIILIVSVPLYSMYKKQEINKLIEITNDLFKEYTQKQEEDYKNMNMKATYKPTETVILAGDKNEFIGQVFFELNVDVNGENDYTSAEHKMRIKKMNNNEYNVIQEGVDVTNENLEIINYSNKDTKKADKIKDEINETEYKKVAGVYYSIDNDGLKLSFDKKETWTNVPIPNEYLISNIEEEGVVMKLKTNNSYISHKKTAFISTNQSDILIKITDDKGKTWEEVVFEGAYQGGDLYIGFSSNEVGYFALTTDVAMGRQNNYIYTTKDGGKTWTEIGNTNETYARVVTGVGFLDDKVGFVGFRYEDNNNPIVYRTDDAGNTWKELRINLPYEYANDYATPLSPYVKGDKVMLPVKLRDSNIVVNFISNDKGLTWEFSE